MTRLRADLLLLLAAIIWGFAFVAQKTAMESLGPFGFSGVRFALSLIVIMPFVLREARTRPPVTKASFWPGVFLCLSFVLGVIGQQVGLVTTSVANAGFLTSLYVIIVPFIAWILFRHRPRAIIWPACAVAVLGVWFLNGASLSAFRAGDWLVLACALFFAVQVVLMGLLVQRTGRPLFWSAAQYGFCVLVGLAVGFGLEGISLAAITDNLVQILYAGIISGGVAYTVQAVAQQYTPPSDAAIILSGEALFAALAGMLLLEEHLTGMGWLGCALILVAILMVELGPKRAENP